MHGTFGNDFINLVVWQIWLRLPNLMYANTTYNHMYYEQCTLNITLFANRKCPPLHIMCQLTELIVRQVYCVYGIDHKYIVNKKSNIF